MKTAAIIIGGVALGYLVVGMVVGGLVVYSLGGKPTFWKLVVFAFRWPWFLWGG